LTTEDEKKMGRKIFLEMEESIVRDPSVQSFLNRVGNSLVSQVGSTPFEFKFYLVNGSSPNAFAVPGGYTFVTTGLIVMAENEGEIAGVLAHEIAHVVQRHVAKMIEKSGPLNIAALAAMLAGALAGRGGAASQATGAMAMGMAGATLLKYTRDMEVDADQNGLRYLVKAGYDPKGLLNFLGKLQKVSLAVAPKIPAYLVTHPETETRISLLENLLQLEPNATGPFRPVENIDKIHVRAFVEERDPDVAVSHYESMTKKDPRDVTALYGLGLANRKMGRLDRSMEVLQNAEALVPGDLDVSREVGIAYFLLGKLDQAIENLEATRSNPAAQNSDLLTLFYLGRAYQEKGEFARALPLLVKVHKEMPEMAAVYSHLGSVYGRMNQKGLYHFYYGKHFKWRRDRNNALLHFRESLQWLDRTSPERDEAQQEIKELTPPK